MLRYLYVILFARYIVYVQSMCVSICISIGTKFTNLENMQKSYVLFYVTLRKKTVRRSSCRCNRLSCPLARMSGLQCFNMGHNGHGINLYGVSMTLMGN